MLQFNKYELENIDDEVLDNLSRSDLRKLNAKYQLWIISKTRKLLDVMPELKKLIDEKVELLESFDIEALANLNSRMSTTFMKVGNELRSDKSRILHFVKTLGNSCTLLDNDVNALRRVSSIDVINNVMKLTNSLREIADNIDVEEIDAQLFAMDYIFLEVHLNESYSHLDSRTFIELIPKSEASAKIVELFSQI